VVASASACTEIPLRSAIFLAMRGKNAGSFRFPLISWGASQGLSVSSRILFRFVDLAISWSL